MQRITDEIAEVRRDITGVENKIDKKITGVQNKITGVVTGVQNNIENKIEYLETKINKIDLDMQKILEIISRK